MSFKVQGYSADRRKSGGAGWARQAPNGQRYKWATIRRRVLKTRAGRSAAERPYFCGVCSKDLLGSPARRGVDAPDRQEIVVTDQAEIVGR